MKKKIALALTLALLALPIGVFAENTSGNIGNGGTGTGEVMLTVDGNTAIEYFVTVEWDDLEFEYVYGSWDQVAHIRNEGWTDKIGRLIVKNDSNGAIKFNAVYEANDDYENLAIKFGDAERIENQRIEAATTGLAGPEGTETATVNLTIDGTPENADLEDTKIGTIRITVSAA